VNEDEDTGMNEPDRFVFEAPGSARPQRSAAVAADVPRERDAGGGLLEFGERQLRDFEKSPRPMRIFDRETLRYLAVNDAAVALYGYTREEFLTLTVKDTLHPDEHEELLESFDKPEGYLMHFEPRRHLKKSGEVFVAEIVIQDILFEARRARVSLTIDVTERIRVSNLLRQREQEFETLAEHLPDAIARFDRNGRYVYVNSAVEKLTGASRNAILGRTPRELFMPDTVVGLFESSLAETVRSGQAHTFEFSYPSASGNDRLFEAPHVPERDAPGEMATVLCVARDITERKQAEEEQQRQKKLLTAIIDNLPVGIFIKDATTLRLLMVNRASRVLITHPREGVLGKTPHQLFPAEQADAFSKTDRQALESGQMVEIPEQEVSGRSGKSITQHVRKVP
jgi:PAS domain S-box-containing protein